MSFSSPKTWGHFRKTLLVVIQLVVVADAATAQVKARIQGPPQAELGDLIVLDGSSSEAVELRWLLTNSDKQFLTVGQGKRLVFSTGTPGRFRFLLVAGGSNSEGQLEVDFSEWTVVVQGSGPNPDVPAPDHPEPNRPSDSDLESLTHLVAEWSGNVNSGSRTNEAKILADSFRSFGLRAEDFDSVAELTKATSDDYKAKLGVAAYLPWSQEVLTPLTEELRRLRNAKALNDLKDFGAVWAAIATGLEEAAR